MEKGQRKSYRTYKKTRLGAFFCWSGIVVDVSLTRKLRPREPILNKENGSLYQNFLQEKQ
ncbi:MAG: hypothetical protein US98_C0022G0002 [Parcubacteria group bacterium GW2011_GWC1_38_6]|nr:MAG: hypothetical protein UR98_C0002G0018 [Parcubacteria group bacterium GW2011_GWA1_36_12]KKQ76857.1 MAG: hypothetical protein US98_C0022G0002 [Parcubacteria group bacterium GW2011_GWC1_38_6]